MKLAQWSLAVLLSFTGAGYAAGSEEKGYSDDFGPYAPVVNWLKPVHPGCIEVGYSVFAESPDRIIYLTPSEMPASRSKEAPKSVQCNEHHFLMIVDGNGNVVDEWKLWNDQFVTPHVVQISPYDPERSLWVIDRDGSQVFKFSHDGKRLLLRMGEKGVVANDDKHFGKPADISFAPDGSYYIADGYANTRVIKFDKDNKRTLTWGTPGTGPGQFKVQVHDVAVDKQGRVYVADRGNNRIQIFTPDGTYIDEWDRIEGPSFIYITKDDFVWVVSGRGNRLLKYDMKGRLLTYWGMYGVGPGQLDNPHNLSVDSAGNLYVAITSRTKVGLEKFTPRSDADRSRLITPGLNRYVPMTATTP